MEHLFGASFADVELITDSWVEKIGARACAGGCRVVFAPGQFHPETNAGGRLIAHELTHVLQQRAGRVRNPCRGQAVVLDDPLLEYEARCMEAEFSGESPPDPPLFFRGCRALRLGGRADDILQCAFTEQDGADATRVKWTNIGHDSQTSDAPDGWYVHIGNNNFRREGAADEIFDYTPARGTLLRKGLVLPRLADAGPAAFILPPSHGPGLGPSYGLLQREVLTIQFDPGSGTAQVTKHPAKDPATVVLAFGPRAAFGNMPEYITADGVPFYPHKYEFSHSPVLFFMPTPPAREALVAAGRPDDYTKSQEQDLTVAILRLYDREGRIRFPDQGDVMGESAVEHVTRLLGVAAAPRSWHWCHLIAHSMRPDSTAQVQGNLVCATAGCNGDMLNLEAAVKSFVKKYDVEVNVEVTADVIGGTHVASRIRYRISRPYHGSCTYYLSPQSHGLSIRGDYDVVLKNLENQLNPPGGF